MIVFLFDCRCFVEVLALVCEEKSTLIVVQVTWIETTMTALCFGVDRLCLRFKQLVMETSMKGLINEDTLKPPLFCQMVVKEC